MAPPHIVAQQCIQLICVSFAMLTLHCGSIAADGGGPDPRVPDDGRLGDGPDADTRCACWRSLQLNCPSDGTADSEGLPRSHFRARHWSQQPRNDLAPHIAALPGAPPTPSVWQPTCAPIRSDPRKVLSLNSTMHVTALTAAPVCRPSPTCALVRGRLMV